MTRFIIWSTAVVITVMFVATLAAEFLLPARPLDLEADLQAFGFGVCDLPCYAEIRVGETRGDDVSGLIEQHVAGRGRVLEDDLPPFETDGGELSLGNGTMYSFTRRVDRRQFNANILARDGVVITVSLNGLIRLDTLLAAVGAPTCASFARQTSTSTLMRLIWLTDDMIITATVPTFQDDWGVDSLTLGVQIAYDPSMQVIFGDGTSIDTVGGACETNDWIGFARIEQYEARANLTADLSP